MLTAAATQRAERNAAVRELRLALVCYGGVSLAIYMHGITKEVQKLVVASRAFERDPKCNPFCGETVEHAYWHALRTAWERSSPDSPDNRIVTRVVVDVVAGASAGGINGVILCKALAHNRSQDALRDLWFQRGDFKQLLGGSWWKAQRTIVRLALSLLFRTEKARPPLDGNAMLSWLAKALDTMDASAPPYQPTGGAPCESLMPEAHPLELIVTTTDYYGYRNSMLIEDPATVSERRNRHLFKFSYRRGEERDSKDQFGAAHNGALAFAARASSSFPGAFPPVNLAMAAKLGVDLNAFQAEFFKVYELSGASAEDTYFIDGGVLNNYPFRPAIGAIFDARAEAEVDRYLLYIQPDPGPEVVNPTGEEPSLFGVVWAGLSTIAGAQPIYDELLAVRDFNERVRMIDEMVEQTRGKIDDFLQELKITTVQLKAQNPVGLAAERVTVETSVEEKAGFLYQPYIEIRVRSVIDQFAGVIANLCGYIEPESNVAYLIRVIVDRWACDRKARLVGLGAHRDAQKELLRAFDLGYTRRRLTFVKDGVNQLYKKDPQTARSRGLIATRASLNRAKVALFDRIEELSGLIDGRSGDAELEELAAQVRGLFPLPQLLEDLRTVPVVKVATDFLSKNAEKMEALYAEAGRFLRRRKVAIQAELYDDFREITAEWSQEDRRAVLVRYLGFPYWDAMIYPLVHLAEAGELHAIKVVRVSPTDSTKLGTMPVGKKLMGVKLAHFGAFLRRDWRENDYLWGRLDAAERLIGLVLHPSAATATPPAPNAYRAKDWEVKPAFAAILAEEKGSLKSIQLEPFAQRIKDLDDAPDTAPG